MTAAETYGIIAIFLLFIFLSGFFSIAETALNTVRRSKLESMLKNGNVRAGKALDLMGDPDRLLIPIRLTSAFLLMSIGFIGAFFLYPAVYRVTGDLIASGGIASLREFPYLPDILLIGTMIDAAYAVMIFGRLIPERIALSDPEKITMAVIRPLSLYAAFLSPFTQIATGIAAFLSRLAGIRGQPEIRATEEDIKAIVHEGFEDGEIEETEQNLVERVFSLSDRKISSVLTHKSDIVWLEADMEHDEVRRCVLDALYNVYPVAEESLDNVIGVVTLKDLFNTSLSDVPLRQLAKPANFLPENVSVLETLESFRETHFEYALVTDEFGSVQGIVTLSDLLNAFVGDSPVESAGGADYEIRKEDGDIWIVDGQYPFYDLLSHLDVPNLYNDNPYNTLSGLILDIMDRIPQTGDTISWKGFEMDILEMDRVRIDKVRIRRIDEPDGTPEG